jgi:type I restriction enzyme S subunit
MEVKPGYVQTGVGVIPADWEIEELRDFVRYHNSGIYKKRSLYGKGYNIIGVSDLYNVAKVDGQIFGQVPLLQKELSRYSLQSGELLYAESSLVRDGIARTVYATDRGASTTFAWHTRRYGIDQRRLRSSYLYYYLQSRPARRHMIEHSIQTAITGINTVAYFACPVVIPPPREQDAIAEALSEADALIESTGQLIIKKRGLRQGAMQELLTGKKRLPGFERATGYKQTEVGEIPEDWTVRWTPIVRQPEPLLKV